jgi:DNA processing protein
MTAASPAGDGARGVPAARVPAGELAVAAARACDGCLRRSWLLARLAGWLEHARHEQSRVTEVLALPDRKLIAALAVGETDLITAELGRFDAGAARVAVGRAGLLAVCRHHELYPPRLLHARDAPATLHVAGDVRHLARLASEDERTVAIVGTRRASRDGLHVARALGRDLGVAGVPVVSGMALGIDAAAQSGALDGGGLSVAVLASGAETAYPRSKQALHRALVARGLVLSELPPGTRPWRWAFPARNRTIAGLADLTVVVEAAERSGSLITAELAMRLGREVAAVPGPVTVSINAGSNGLLRDGALLVRGAQDVLDALYGVGGAPAVRRADVTGLEPHLRTLLDAVAEGRDTVAALAGGSPDDAARALVGLSELELRGLVVRGVGGRYAVSL